MPRLAEMLRGVLAALTAALALGISGPSEALTLLRIEAERVQDSRADAQQLRVEVEAHTGDVRLSIGRLQLRERPLGPVQMRCQWTWREDGHRCDHGHISLGPTETVKLEGAFALSFSGAEAWHLRLPELRAQFHGEDAAERWVAERLQLVLHGDLQQTRERLHGEFEVRVTNGEALIDPVYLNFGETPLRARAHLAQGTSGQPLQVSDLQVSLQGVGHAEGSLHLRTAQGLQGLGGNLQLHASALKPATEQLLQPFLVGTRMQGATAEGEATATVTLEKGGLRALNLLLNATHAQIPSLNLQGSALQGNIHWRLHGDAPESRLHWATLRFARVEAEGGTVRFRTQGRALSLLAPLRLPFLDGALRIHHLALAQVGLPVLRAELDAELEPIDLAALCRALGWPVFGGQLSGRIPGLRIENERLSLEGALQARAFDGEIRLDQLTILQPLGPLPRITADLRLRRLDLKAVTQAFDFGRIEGRLNGDILGLKLLRWRPVAMNAHLYSTPGDRSRRRISQRAIENIARAGGGATQVLSRSVLRVFDDFAYDKIGWRCELQNNVCEMSGIEPANGGYLLVKGKWLPRIDVVGYSQRVSWNTFLDQLQAAIDSEGAEIR